MLWEQSVEGEKKTEIVVSIHQYNTSAPKINFAKRYFTKEGEGKFKKLGRLTKEEAERLLELLPVAIKEL